MKRASIFADGKYIFHIGSDNVFPIDEKQYANLGLVDSVAA